MTEKPPRPHDRYSGWPIVCKSLTNKLAFLGSLTVPILAAFPVTTALMPMLLTLLGLTAVAVGLMGLLAQNHGHHAKQPAADLVPALVLIASHEPPLRSMTGRRADAPSRAPPSRSHLVGLTSLSSPHWTALPKRFDLGVVQRA